jgi:hypothetical protein
MSESANHDVNIPGMGRMPGMDMESGPMPVSKDHTMAPSHHQGHQIADFRKRFWVSLVLTAPILVLSPVIQQFLGLSLRFSGDTYVLFGLATHSSKASWMN